jgi:integrating conjugative element protein (TIGR03765 family)
MTWTINPIRVYRLGLVVAAMVLSTQVNAELFVIKDYGNTRPSGIPDLNALPTPSGAKTKPIFEPFQFPIESDTWQLGSLDGHYAHQRKIDSRFLIVGADAQSRAWLQRNSDYFRQEKITQGVIVEAATLDDLTATYQLAERLGIELALSGIDDLASILGTRIYPILVTPTEVKQ